MLPPYAKKIILFYAKEDEAWKQRLSGLAGFSDYQAVLFLLAVDTGMPLLARDFFAVMEEGIHLASLNEASLNIKWLVKRMDELDPPVH
jgi:hypothetical protein